MVKVKVCGITNLEDAQLAKDLGADALGFIFYRKSPRYITPEKVRFICKNLKGGVLKVGVFVNEQKENIFKIAHLCSLDAIQFHGEETPEFCEIFKEFQTIKAFRIKNEIFLREIAKYKTDFYLFDTFVENKPGGTAKTFNWLILKKVRERIKKPIFLSGGINLRNLKEAIETISPDWLDLCSSLEEKPGKKSLVKMREFFCVLKKI